MIIKTYSWQNISLNINGNTNNTTNNGNNKHHSSTSGNTNGNNNNNNSNNTLVANADMKNDSSKDENALSPQHGQYQQHGQR